MGIIELVPDIREELERQRAAIAELARRIGTIKEGSTEMSTFFLEVRCMNGRHETGIAGLRQSGLDTPSPSLSRGPPESSRLSVPIYSGGRSTLPTSVEAFLNVRFSA